LPGAGGLSDAARKQTQIATSSDRMLHLRLQGQKLGTFDVYFDTQGGEEIWAGQTKNVEGATFYDLWTSFTPIQSQTGAAQKTAGEEVATSRSTIAVEVTPPTPTRA